MSLIDKMEGKDELLYADGAKHWVENPKAEPIKRGPHTLTRIVNRTPTRPFVFRAHKEGGE